MSEESRNLPQEQRNPPAAPMPLDRGALERILARAAELQTSQGDPSETLTEQQLLDIGKEVGLSTSHIRQALAEERTRVDIPEESGRLAEYFGPSRAIASRVVKGKPHIVIAALDKWMQNEESLQVKRRFADRMTWEARRDLVGSIQRGFNFSGRSYALTPAFEIGATVLPIDESSALVHLTADMETPRQQSVRWSIVSGALGTGSAVSLLAFTVSAGGSVVISAVIAAMLGIAGISGATAIARSNRSQVMKAQLALEQVLDRMEHGEVPGQSVLGLLGAAVRQVSK